MRAVAAGEVLRRVIRSGARAQVPVVRMEGSAARILYSAGMASQARVAWRQAMKVWPGKVVVSVGPGMRVVRGAEDWVGLAGSEARELGRIWVGRMSQVSAVGVA